MWTNSTTFAPTLFFNSMKMGLESIDSLIGKTCRLLNIFQEPQSTQLNDRFLSLPIGKLNLYPNQSHQSYKGIVMYLAKQEKDLPLLPIRLFQKQGYDVYVVKYLENTDKSTQTVGQFWTQLTTNSTYKGKIFPLYHSSTSLSLQLKALVFAI